MEDKGLLEDALKREMFNMYKQVVHIWSTLWKIFITKLFQSNNAILCVSLKLNLYMILHY